MEEKVTLSQLREGSSRKVINPADLLPKKELEVNDPEKEALGDLAYVIAKENAETEAIGQRMIQDMQLAKAKGLQPEFRTDALATEGLQPINVKIDRNTPGIDSRVDIEIAKPSEALDVNAVQSVTNYIKAPTYVDAQGNIMPGQEGPRSIIKDNNESVGYVYDQSVESGNNTPVEEQEVDPDEMTDEEIKALLGEEYIDMTEPQEVKVETKVEVKTLPEVTQAPIAPAPVLAKATPVVEQPVEQDIDEDDEYSEEVGGDEELVEYTDEQKEQLLSVIKSKVRKILRPQKFDISSFTVANPTKVVNLFTGQKVSNTVEADWYLPATGVNITMSRFLGTDIVALNGNADKSVRNSNEDILRLIYDHITNPTKPDFETFIRSVKMEDMEHLYFAIFRASYKDANYVPYYCTNQKCKDIDMVLQSFDDMVEFYNEKDKEKFYEHLETATYNFVVDAVEMERVPISEDYCVDIKLPSLYDILIEPTYLSKKYRVENKENITLISYIENVYKIDAVNQQLIPIDYMLDTTDESKIIKNKYRLFVQFLNSLTSDDYSFLTSLVNKLTADKSICTFVIPEHKCVKCNKVVEKTETTAMKLLFTRHQLATLANI